jgi:hypothetical protein
VLVPAFSFSRTVLRSDGRTTHEADGAFLACLVCCGWFAAAAAADGNSLRIGSASQGKGQTIAVTGSYTVAAGYTLCGVTVLAQPATVDGAGEGGRGAASTNKGAFTAAIDVPVGTYTVQAILEVKDGKGQISHYFSEAIEGVRVGE